MTFKRWSHEGYTGNDLRGKNYILILCCRAEEAEKTKKKKKRTKTADSLVSPILKKWLAFLYNKNLNTNQASICLQNAICFKNVNFVIYRYS